MILAIDQGTTGSTCLVFDGDGRITGRAYSEFEQHFPRPGWVEHDAGEIWETTRRVGHEALADAGVDGADLAAIGITNQRETVVGWDPGTGEPIHHALVWQDRRTASRCEELKEAGHEDLVRERTGLVIDPYFSGTKIEWLLRNVEAAERAAFGTIDSWLTYKLTGEHVTDLSNASRTMLLDIRTGEWDRELCEMLGVDPASLPRPRGSAEVLGTTSEFGGEVPVAGVAGDQQAALFGQACHSPGDAKNTYGTGSFVLLNTGTEPLGGDRLPDRRRGARAGGSLGEGAERAPGRRRCRRQRVAHAVPGRRARSTRDRARDLRDDGAGGRLPRRASRPASGTRTRSLRCGASAPPTSRGSPPTSASR